MRYLRSLIPVVFAGMAVSSPSAAYTGVSIGLSITVAPTGATGLCPAPRAWTELHLGTWLLGLG